MEHNPYSLLFGKEPLQVIPRIEDVDQKASATV